MRYTTPQLSILGDAAHVIQILQKPNGSQPDGVKTDFDPAYDLDE
jgi:hypothetical protein